MPDDPEERDVGILGGARCAACPRLRTLLEALAALRPTAPSPDAIEDAAEDACIGCATARPVLKLQGERLVLELFPAEENDL